jgi:cytochrome c553/cytochrome c5
MKIGLVLAAGAMAAVKALVSDKPYSSGTHLSTQATEDKSFVAWLKPMMWRTAKYFAAFAILMAVGGFLVAASGILPIKASSGHWAITRWFLNFSSSRSVSTHTLGMKTPNLKDSALVLKGAGAYETNCRACHGSPSLPHPRVARNMTPQPPYLPDHIAEWESRELFYIVKHGIKFTGMPAWPSQKRDDEVWAMVAFLREFATMDEPKYRQLAMGETSRIGEVAPIHSMLGAEGMPGAVLDSCARCHGVDGMGRGTGAFPKLAGQKPEYLFASLKAFARDERFSGVMQPVAAGLSEDDMRKLALYYGSRQNPLPASYAPGTEIARAVERGAAIAMRGIPGQDVPSCTSCHTPYGSGKNPIFPVLTGQYAGYLLLQLELFKKGARGGTPYSHIMQEVASRLTHEQMVDVALYFSIPPSKGNSE